MKWFVMFYLLVPLFSVLYAYSYERTNLSDKGYDPVLIEYYLSHFELRVLDIYVCGWLHGAAAFLNHWLLWPAFIKDDLEIIRQNSRRVDCFLSRYPDNYHKYWYQNGKYHRTDEPAIQVVE